MVTVGEKLMTVMFGPSSCLVLRAVFCNLIPVSMSGNVKYMFCNYCVLLTVFCRGQWYINSCILIHSATIRPLKMKNMSFEMFLFAYIISSSDKWILKVNKLYSYIYTKCLGYSKDTLIC